MSIVALTKQLLSSLVSDGDINYEPYDLRKVQAFYGLPPIPIRGLSYIRASFTAPRTQLVQSLTGGGVHLDNLNISGVVEIGLMAGSASGGAIQVMAVLKQPFPLIIEDTSGGGSMTVVAPSCRLGEQPDWNRELKPGVDVYTFTSARMSIVPGMRLVSEI
jgi:hypothetical protein